MQNFTPDLMQALADLPVTLIKGVISVDGPTYFRVFREFLAVGDFVDYAEANYHDNLIIQQALSRFINEEGGIESGLDHDEVTHVSQDEVLASVDQVTAQLGNSPQALEFRAFLYELAGRVASAAGSGLFGGGVKVSDGEAQFLAALKARLGV